MWLKLCAPIVLRCITAYSCWKLKKLLCPNNHGSRNSHCEYKSMGLFVTGEPVSIRLNLACFPRETIVFVRFASLFFMVVLSSTAISASCATKNRSAISAPFLVLRASTFITNTLRLSSGKNSLRCISICFFVWLGFQRTMSCIT